MCVCVCVCVCVREREIKRSWYVVCGWCGCVLKESERKKDAERKTKKRECVCV